MPSGTWPEIRDFHKVVHLSDWQAKDVEDASVGKVEGPHQGLTMVGGGRWVGRVEKHSVFSKKRIELFS